MFSAKHISVLILAFGLSLSVFAQGGGKNAAPPRRGPNQMERRPGPHFGDWLRNSKNLTPQQKEKALENDPNFQKLPQDRQERLKERLQKFDSLPPEQQQRILQRMETWEHMTPEQHKQARGLFDRMQALPDERRNAVRDQVRALSSMTPDQRQRYMNSDQYKRNYSEDERNLMQGWMSLRDSNTGSASPTLDEPRQQP